MVLFPSKGKATTFDDNRLAIGTQHGFPTSINLWDPRNNSLETLFSPRENPVPVIFETSDRFLEHLEEPAPLGERDPSVLLRIPLWL